MYIRGMEYLPRLLDARFDDLVAALPAVSIIGPRASGKSTTARRHAAEVVHLDREAEALAFRADPDSAIAHLDAPALLDEWQMVPEVLGAIKRRVDEDARPGQFILTGSARAHLDVATWPGTGRLVSMWLGPLVQRELCGRTADAHFLDVLADHDPRIFLDAGRQADTLALGDYLELALRGGFPDPALRLTGVARDAWLDSYLGQVLDRDAAMVGNVRDIASLRRLLEFEALMTAGVFTDMTVAQAAGVDRRTITAYQGLLVDLGILDLLPAWQSNRVSRLVQMPKHHLTDTGLAAAALRLDQRGVLRDGRLLGGLLESFVAMQLRAEVTVASTRPRLFHLRDKGGTHEVDIVIEYGGGRVAGIEVKATSAPKGPDGQHLAWLRDRLGDRFIGGVVLHTGRARVPLGDRVVALPISDLWASR